MMTPSAVRARTLEGERARKGRCAVNGMLQGKTGDRLGGQSMI